MYDGETQGQFLVMTIAFLTGHSVAHSAHLLRSARFATLALLARSIHGLAHSLRSLSCGAVEIHESVFMPRSRSKETNAIMVVTRNTPNV